MRSEQPYRRLAFRKALWRSCWGVAVLATVGGIVVLGISLQGDPVINEATCAQIDDGMTLAEVVAMIGHLPDEEVRRPTVEALVPRSGPRRGAVRTDGALRF